VAFVKVKMKQIILFIIVIGFVSCGSLKIDTRNKTKYNNESSNDDPNRADINFGSSLGDFMQTIDLSKLCYPVKLYVVFTVDTTGKIIDPDFKPDYITETDCSIDTNYIDSLKKEFENYMPIWKPIVVNDTVKEVRMSIPVTFN
jgi:hypothetical protein